MTQAVQKVAVLNKLKTLDDDIDMFYQAGNNSPGLEADDNGVFSADFTINSILADIIREYQNDRDKAVDPKIKPRINNKCSRGHSLANPEIIQKGKIILKNRP